MPAASDTVPTTGIPAAAATGALFGASNLTWRFGEGSALVIGAVRLAAGGVLLGPFLIRSLRRDGISWLREPWAAATVLVSALGLLLPAILFRLAPLSWQLATLALQPAAVALIALACRGKRPRVLALVLTLLSTLAALIAQLGAPLPTHPAVLLAAGGILLSEGLRSALTERAMNAGAPALPLSLIPAILAAPVMLVLALSITGGFSLTVLGLVAGAAVAVLGSCGRITQAISLRSLPAALSSALNTSIQLSVMGIGGMLLFDDTLRLSQVLLLTAAVVLALLSSSRTAPEAAASESPEGEPLDLMQELGPRRGRHSSG